MAQFNIAEAKSHFSELVQKALLGEDVVIAKDNKPLLKLVPVHPVTKERQPGSGKDRIVFIGSPIDDELSNLIIAQLLFLESEDPDQDINIYINTPGGYVMSGLAIYDTMQFVNCDVATYCLGQAASMGAVLLAAGAKGKRHALPNSRIMIHQPLAGMEGTATDILIHVKEFRKVKDKLNRILLKHTGHPLEKIEQDTDRDRFMSADEALEYGLVDRVVEHMERAAEPA